MKLNKQQISALAKKITTEINAPVKKHNKAIMDSEEYTNFFETCPDCIELSRIKEKYDLSENTIHSIQNRIRICFFDSKFMKEYNIYSCKVEEDIIIETIEDVSVEELINKLIEKYKHE